MKRTFTKNVGDVITSYLIHVLEIAVLVNFFTRLIFTQNTSISHEALNV